MFRLKRVFKKPQYITLQQDEMKNEEIKEEIIEIEDEKDKPSVPNGLWVKCKVCGETIYKEDLNQNNRICSNCGKHYRLSSKERIELVIDKDTFIETNENIASVNPLEFDGYSQKVDSYKEKTGMSEAVVTGVGKIQGLETVIAVMDSNFMMGSMGSVVGEKVTRAVELATEKNLPIVIFTASGGARMQEGILSLMQMAKTSAAIAKHNESGNLYITVLTDPTTGGVTASFAMLGDIILSEPGTLIGFAGKRVIEQTIKQKLPKGFQTAEFLLEHGFIDKIVDRKQLKETLAKIIDIHQSCIVR
ncbi:acetyl-CoA carboxylase, carboxyltransferase subunit beta [Clostridium sp. DL1XJH146]